MKLFPFQIETANQIRARYEEYRRQPSVSRRGGTPVEEPFIQILQSITGSGKTPMLAWAVADMRLLDKRQPLVLWISKGRVVVDQTAANLRQAGKYSDLVEGFEVRTLADVKVAEVLDDSLPLIVTSTVAAFNQDDTSDLNVYKPKWDKGSVPIWEALKQRSDKAPVFVVYDEGHNSTDRQIDKLLELRPRAIILASATMDMTPGLLEIAKNQGFTQDMTAIRENKDRVVTWVDTKQAVAYELIKSTIDIGGRSSIDEYIIEEMYQEFVVLKKAGQQETPPITPRCIYVTTTNVFGPYGAQDDPTQPFKKRKARPVVIWRILTEKCGVDPAAIAVYCDLRIKKPPTEFRLFKGGDKDYAAFIAGNFEHIIFNMSLQEGWDDPECYLAYIDKEMGSRLQITQVIGRVLRQPRANYSAIEELNAAHFFIRLHTKQEFKEVLEDIKKDLEGKTPGIKVTGNWGKEKIVPPALKPKKKLQVPKLAADRTSASEAMTKVLTRFPDLRNAATGINASGHATDVRVDLQSGDVTEGRWHQKGPGQPIIIGKYLRKKLQELSPSAAEVVDFSAKPKFSAVVELGSPACEQADHVVEELGRKYEEHVEIIVSNTEPYDIPPFQPRSSDVMTFRHSVHSGYDGLNDPEVECALAIDKMGWPWARNPSQTGYRVPLPIIGPTRNFFPDFIVFTADKIWLIDPKGGHLLRDAIRQKLLDIKTPPGVPEVHVALISKGRYGDDGNQESKDGVTLYRVRSGNQRAERFDSYDECVNTFIGRRRRSKAK